MINAYIRPVVSSYLQSLKHRLTAMSITAPILLMQSSGGAIPGALAAENPITIIESGPAAGVVGAQRLGERLGMPDLMVLDMGGTTAKASVIEDGSYVVATETEVGGGPGLAPGSSKAAVTRCRCRRSILPRSAPAAEASPASTKRAACRSDRAAQERCQAPSAMIVVARSRR